MSNFDLLSKAYRSYIEEYLENIYAEYKDLPQKQLFEAMEYSLLAGGKRLRPIFVFDFCPSSPSVPTAAAPIRRPKF